MGDLTRVLDRLGSPGRLLVAGIAVVTIAAVFYLVKSGGPAAYAPAFTNLTPRQAGDVEAARGGAGITPKLQAGGSTIAVPTSQMDAARIAVAKAGIAVNGQ